MKFWPHCLSVTSTEGKACCRKAQYFMLHYRATRLTSTFAQTTYTQHIDLSNLPWCILSVPELFNHSPKTFIFCTVQFIIAANQNIYWSISAQWISVVFITLCMHVFRFCGLLSQQNCVIHLKNNATWIHIFFFFLE